MKKLSTSLLLFIIFQIAGKAQNTFPASGNAGIGTTTPGFPLEVRRISSTTGFNAAGSFYSEQTAASTSNVTGLSGYGKTSHSAGTVAINFGLVGNIENSGAGAVTSMRSVQGGGVLTGSGAVGEWICFNAGFSISGAGTVGNAYGLYVNNFAASIPNKYGVYVSDVTAKNYFGGSIGIGTTNPGTFKLAVEGKIGAREVRVTNTNPWPDYVFDRKYKKLSLSELEKFIQKNDHLPNIPEAKEVKENGIELGVMNAKLLEKIEELTLYLIEIKKQNDQLAKRVDLLELKAKKD